MTHKELEQHLISTLDSELSDMRRVSWHDLERLHMICSCLNTLWHSSMHDKMGYELKTESYIKEATTGGTKARPLYP